MAGDFTGSALASQCHNATSDRRHEEKAVGRRWWKHQLADGFENDLKLGVVFVFERGKLAGKFRIREEHLAQAHKCAHDGDVDLHGPRTPQHAGKHRDALLGEGVGKITTATATAL